MIHLNKNCLFEPYKKNMRCGKADSTIINEYLCSTYQKKL